MKENKQLLIFSIIMTVISIIVIAFTLQYENNFWCNIFQNILAGTVVLIGTTWISYERRKRIILEKILNYCNKFSNKFGKIQHLEELITYEEYKQKKLLNKGKTDEGITEKMIKLEYQNYKTQFVNQHKKEAEKIMKYYIELSNIDLEDFWDLYGELEFIIHRNLKIELYNEAFEHTHELINKIKEKAYHFNIYFEQKNGNILVNINFINKLQRNFFTESNLSKINNIEENRIANTVYYQSEGKCYYNSQQLYYAEEFEKIKKITY